MTTFAKIRLLLALLFASLLLTAVIIHNSHTPQFNFIQSARTLENNLQQKEKLANSLLSGEQFKKLKKLPNNDQFAMEVIDYYTKVKRLWVVTMDNNNLKFWSGIKILPGNYQSIKEGSSFIRTPNGYYEAIKKTEGSFSSVIFIHVKNHFKFENKYLRNDFEPELLKTNNLEIADVTDKDVYHIHNINQSYLFSVKLKDRASKHNFNTFEITLWVASLITLCLLISNVCNYLVHKKQLLTAIGTLALSLLVIRFINIRLHFPDLSGMALFDPSLYRLSNIFPSLGDFCLNILAFCWFSAFLYKHRHKLIKDTPGKVTGYIIFISGICILLIISTISLRLFNSLVFNSSITFDVNNVLNLSFYSVLGLVMTCFSFLIFYLLIDTFLAVSIRIHISATIKTVIFLSAMILATGVSYFYEFTTFYILGSLLILIRAYAIRNENGSLNAVSFVSLVLISSLIASIKLNSFEQEKEHETRKQLIDQLEEGNNSSIRQVLNIVEEQIINDPFLITYFKNAKPNAGYLKDKLQKQYFDGYLADYDIKLHEFNSKGVPILESKDYSLNDFKDMVLYSSIKVSDYFYRENEAFGLQRYFAILPVYEADDYLGTLIIELKSKPMHSDTSFPELLIENPVTFNNKFKDYSYAFYSDNRLLSQSGKFDYDVMNNEFKGQLHKYIFKTTYEATPSKSWMLRFDKYSHLIYQPSPRKVIVVTRQENNVVNNIASLTFFFVVLLSFSLSIIILNWMWARISIVKITRDSIRWDFKLDFDRILYKTRIQFSMIFAVVSTLTLVGAITFVSIKHQYQEQQDEAISEKVSHIAAKLENSFINDIQHVTEESQVKFNLIADDFSTDLTLFDRQGIPLLSTQPKIYTYGLLSRRMNATAYLMLTKLQKSLLVNSEKVAGLNYKAAYAPIRNSKNVTVAYLQLPSFSDEAEYRERIGAFLNAMINIYALIFIAIGMFAVLIARQITTPLSFIQHNLSKTMYGKKNEPIQWKRHDEIGALVREYNKMIAALEESANRLAQSERESAWREMAKQVAHEIKNPLTPLKLGLQLLEKSWKDKDPKFDLKFERFSKSFVEQIESLSSIASEFSAFAKMPDTRMEKLNIFETLGQAIIIFKQMDNVRINYAPPEEAFMVKADRDQLLRCFNNLLKNAIEAMPPDRTGLIDVTYTVNRNSILLSIKDNGNGIPENLREKIFEPNFTTKSSGTGLGLAFVKNSIENAGGKVWFETATGGGTTFHLSFPAARL